MCVVVVVVVDVVVVRVGGVVVSLDHPVLDPPPPLSPAPFTFHNVQNHGGGGAEGEPGGIARNEEQKKTKKTTHRGKPRQTETKQQRNTLGAGQTKKSVLCVKTSLMEGRRRCKNTAYAHLVQVFRCLRCFGV